MNREPAAIIGVIMAGIALAIGFGLKISGQQVDLIQTFLTALVPLIGGFVIRSQVVPTAKANAQIQEGIDSPKGSTTVAEVIKKVEDDRNATTE